MNIPELIDHTLEVGPTEAIRSLLRESGDESEEVEPGPRERVVSILENPQERAEAMRELTDVFRSEILGYLQEVTTQEEVHSLGREILTAMNDLVEIMSKLETDQGID